MTVWRGRWTPSDRAASVYQYVGFTVPDGARGVHVGLDYDRSRAVLDLGVFDPEGFRGYSGGARDGFAVGPSEATPGYLAGPLPPGTWEVLVGLHRVPEEGVDVRLDIEVGAVSAVDDGGVPFHLPPPTSPGRTRHLPADDGRRWLAGDLHAHTVHSDGALTIDQLGAFAARCGLDFLAVTDHNTVSHHPHLPPAGRRAGVRLLPGQEVTTDSGHANCFGAVGWVDFRRPSDAWLDHAEAAGGLLSVNHPLADDCRWRRPLRRGTPLVELWHTTWDRRLADPLQWWSGWGGVGIGGSDWHRPGEGRLLGRPTTWVATHGDDVLEGLAAGQVAVSASVQGPVLVPHDGMLYVEHGAGMTVVDGDGEERAVVGDRAHVEPGHDPHLLVDGNGLVHGLVRVRPR